MLLRCHCVVAQPAKRHAVKTACVGRRGPAGDVYRRSLVSRHRSGTEPPTSRVNRKRSAADKAPEQP